MIGKTNEFYNERMLQRAMLKRMNARTNDATTNEYYNKRMLRRTMLQRIML